MPDATEYLAIQQLLARFANSFDAKDWPALGDCLADELQTDYSDLRGTPPETMSRERFLELRRSGLHGLQTQHLAKNFEISLKQNEAQTRVSMVIYRRNESGEFFNTHCLYTFGLEQIAARWVIKSIVQKVIMNEGQPSVHKGLKR